MDKGVGLVCLHYACEPTKEKGQKEFLDWIGGAFEIHWSVNPHWDASFKKFPDHPIAKGVKPFTMRDEWYYHMRFLDGMAGVTPILSDLPPASTLTRPDGPHSGNPDVRKAVADGELQHVAWARERPNGGRGFGFTGGHFHKNWGNENFRRTVVNAILWTAHLDVPADGAPVALEEAQVNQFLDKKR
jgi:type 1 glutamine amidotransferase